MKMKGFTIIELLVVLGIIGLLASIAMPSYQRYRVKANNVAAISELQLLMLIQSSFYADNAVYADYTIADRDNNGNINKIITVNGSTYSFSALGLNPSVSSIVKSDGGGQASIIAVRSIGGDVIIATEIEQASSFRKKLSAAPLTDSDIPASTKNIDLTTWSHW